MGAPLEDARHLTQRYERLRQEADAQVSSQSYSLPSFALKSHGSLKIHTKKSLLLMTT